MRAGNEGAGSAQRAAWLFELLSELIAPIMTTIIPKYERKRPTWRPCFQTGRAFLETSMDPDLAGPKGRGKKLNGGPAMHGSGPLSLELQGAMRGISGGFSEPEKLGPTSIWTGRVRSREIPGKGKKGKGG